MIQIYGEQFLGTTGNRREQENRRKSFRSFEPITEKNFLTGKKI
jgi:hypothetical protein